MSRRGGKHRQATTIPGLGWHASERQNPVEPDKLQRTKESITEWGRRVIGMNLTATTELASLSNIASPGCHHTQTSSLPHVNHHRPVRQQRRPALPINIRQTQSEAADYGNLRLILPRTASSSIAPRGQFRGRRKPISISRSICGAFDASLGECRRDRYADRTQNLKPSPALKFRLPAIKWGGHGTEEQDYSILGVAE